MTILIQCSQCHSKLKVKAKLSKGKCPCCGNLFKVPSTSTTDQREQLAYQREQLAYQSRNTTQIFSKINVDTDAEIPVFSPESIHSQENIKPASKPSIPDKRITRKQLLELIYKKVKRGFPKDSAGFNYRITVAIVGLAMITIPLIYLGLISAFAYTLFQYTYHSFNVAFSSLSLTTPIYLGIVLYGTAILFLFIKPFICYLDRPKKKQRLNRADEPYLFQFVDHLCEMIHAPKPEMILIDLEGNATAGYRAKSLFCKDQFVLTIGLPLVANLTISQFSGVLAHEFGHFSQRWGMYLTQTIRTIHHWLKKSVKDPDFIDGFIKSSFYSGNPFLILIAILLWIPKKMIRIILAMLLFISNMFSSFLLRKMEYEADRLQGRLVGVDQMIDTFQSVLEVNYALLIARHQIVQNSSPENVTTNFPEYVSEIRKHLPAEIHDEILVHLDETKTAFLSTHPSLSDRIRVQESFRWPGMLKTGISSKFLFQNFNDLAVIQTKKVFKNLIR